MNKSIICLLVGVITIQTITAQERQRIFKRFKGDISLGYAAPVNSNSNGGVLFAMEPKFAVMDQLAIGVRIEAAVTARFTGTMVNGDPEVEDAKGYGSYLATADYYFTNKYSFRPFAGGGAGVFGVASDEYEDFVSENLEYKFGGMLRVGAEVKHFRFGIEYNFIPETDLFDNNGMGIGRSKNHYVGLKLGVCIGGGPL